MIEMFPDCVELFLLFLVFLCAMESVSRIIFYYLDL